MSRFFLGLGSNLGDRARNLHEAIAAIRRTGIRVIRESAVYETAPMYVEDQPRFLNQAILCDARIPPLTLLRRLHAIERMMGRERDIPNGPRTIDIDILLFDDLTIRNPNLIVPHPKMLERRFVLEPLVELDPDARDPGSGALFRDIVATLPDQGVRIVNTAAPCT